MRLTTARALAILASASACASPREGRAPLSPPPKTSTASAIDLASGPEVAADAAGQAPGGAAAPAPRAPQVALAVPIPANVACTLTSSEWVAPGGSVELATQAGGEPFARGHVGGDVTLWLPAGKPSSPTMELSHGGLTVRGMVPKAAVVLRPAAPFEVGDFLIPKPEAKLSWQGGSGGRLEIGLAVPAQLRTKRAEELAERPCADLALRETSFDVLKGKGGAPTRRARLVDHHVSLTATPQGQPGAVFLGDSRSRTVSVLETSGKKTRIAYDAGAAMVVGWVDTRALLDQLGSYRSSAPRVTFGAPSNESTASERRFCAEDLPLYAERAGAHDTIGRILEGTTIHVEERAAEWSRVSVLTSRILPGKDVRFTVKTAQLDGCAEALPKLSPKP